MSIADIQASAQARMAKSLEQLKTNLAKIRTGRAHPGILDHVQVEDDVKYAVLLLDIGVILHVVPQVLDVLGESLCILVVAGLHQDERQRVNYFWIVSKKELEDK
jgi:hypothetical protein